MKSKLKLAFILLQKMGKSLMLPVSVLPVAGILLGVGSAHFGWMPEAVSTIMAQAGGAIFGSLPLIFAISVALGFTDNDGVAALAATVGFVVLLATMGVLAKLTGHETKSIMGMDSVETGVFGGLVIGAVAAGIFKRYYRIELPSYLAFFAGKRIVPIFTALAAILVAGVFTIIWPPIQNTIMTVSHAAAYENPAMAATLYGFVERLLIPFGLHHIWNVPFFFEIGSFTDAAGKVIHGDINRFFAGDPTAGILGGAYLFKMWGLPAAAFAIWHSAKPEQKQKIGSIMVSAALTSFLTGITEPIEFAFLFVAPLLYGIHAVLAGASQLLFGLLGAKLGFTFSQGFIDYILYYSLDTKPWLVLLVGPIFALIYYGVFRLAIQKLDLKTPGRETEETLADIAIEGLGAGEARAVALIQCFGGRKNIKSLDACITRLRVDLNDISKLQVDRLKSLGATGVLTVGNGAQAIFGPLSENLKSDMEAALRQNLPGVDDESMASLHAPIASSATSNEASATKPTAEILKKVSQWMTALGGSENILSSELCGATRIRLVMKNASQLNENLLRDADVQAVMRLPNEVVHLIVGTTAPIYALAMKK